MANRSLVSTVDAQQRSANAGLKKNSSLRRFKGEGNGKTAKTPELRTGIRASRITPHT
jgi:hypothetical protein